MIASPFWTHTEFDENTVKKITNDALNKADDGELYLEYSILESFSFDDGRLKSVSQTIDSGFGLRAVVDDFSAYAHSNSFTIDALKQAANTVSSTPQTGTGFSQNTSLTSSSLYLNQDIMGSFSQKEKTDFLAKVDQYVRDKDPLVSQVSISLIAKQSTIEIIKPGEMHLKDHRPLVRFSVQVTLTKDDKSEQGNSGFGGRYGYDFIFDETRWKHHADNALRMAHINLTAIPAPAGEMTVVLGNGWPGVLLHEAVGHGLEGDFNRKKTSIYSDRIGEQVAAKGVTVIDEGNIKGERGTLNFDDEGTPTAKNVLIEDGVLKGYMQDRMNARLMNMKPTGNGRRQSYAYSPMPRMTNTYMASGDMDPQEIIASVDKGIYAPTFGGGSVDITSGQFVFEMTEAYLIENGKPTTPIKGATLIGNGPKVMQKISMVGNDSRLDDGVGTCGKSGQGVPVCVGQPSLRIDGITVGGSDV
ncbi:MAG: metalloprotease TldD [Rickettsiales bacterium]|nr:metalloprotease TldD [Rickettsiales bacterium]